MSAGFIPAPRRPSIPFGRRVKPPVRPHERIAGQRGLSHLALIETLLAYHHAIKDGRPVANELEQFVGEWERHR